MAYALSKMRKALSLDSSKITPLNHTKLEKIMQFKLVIFFADVPVFEKIFELGRLQVFLYVHVFGNMLFRLTVASMKPFNFYGISGYD